MLPQLIPNAELSADHVPAPDAPWHEIRRFALTLNGYEAFGSPSALLAVIDSGRRETLSECRARLFFYQRLWNHIGFPPDEASLTCMRELVARIREKVAAGELA